MRNIHWLPRTHAHTTADLPSQVLKPEAMIGGGQGARNRRAGTVGGLCREEDFDGLFKAALQQMIVTAERDGSLGG